MAGIAFLWLGGLEGSFCLVSVGLGVGGVVGVVVVVVVVGMLAARTDMLISPTSLYFLLYSWSISQPPTGTTRPRTE